MDWKELGAAVAKIGLPLLGAILPIPGGAAIGSALAAAIGAPGDQPQDILTALTSSAEAVQKAKEFEMTHEEKMMEMLFADIANARAMQMAALQQSDVFSKRFIYYFAIWWSVFASVYILWITFGTIPEQNVRFADTILGFLLGTVVATIMTFFFGSSRSSQAKDITIEQMTKK